MRWLLIVLTVSAVLAGCDKPAAKPQARPPAQVTVQTIVPRDTPVSFEFVGQTQSAHQVQIRARVDGFLEERVYTEGSLVKAGDVMFRQDPKPFQASLDAAKGALGEQQARLQVANDNLARVKPLTAMKALSQKDLDDATGQQQSAMAAVYAAKANVQQAQLNLGYTTITTPVTGLSSYAQVQDGSYVSGSNSLLTYVAQIDSLWVNFSVSEDDMLKFSTQQAQGVLRAPDQQGFLVQLVLSDGSTFPHQGRITFSNADYNVKTGTFLLRATVPNPDLTLRPGQFVRVLISGAVRPNAVLVPQEAVLQGAKGHFVMLVGKDNTVAPRPVEVGTWHGNDWFITKGLAAGDVVVTDGVARLAPGAKVKITASAPAARPPVAPAGTAGAAAGGPPRQPPGVLHEPAPAAAVPAAAGTTNDTKK